MDTTPNLPNIPKMRVGLIAEEPIVTRRRGAIRPGQTRSVAVEDIRPGMVVLDGLVLEVGQVTLHPPVYRVACRSTAYMEAEGTTMTVLAEVDDEVLEAARRAIAEAGH